MKNNNKEIILKFRGKQYKLPHGLLEVSYEQGQKIITALNNDISDEYMRQLWLVSAVLDIKPRELSGCDKDQLNTAYQICYALVSNCSVPMFDIIKAGKNYFKLKDLSTLTVDDYFNIDNYYRNNPDNILLAGAQVIKQLYQPIKSSLELRIKTKPVSKLFKIAVLHVNSIGNLKPCKQELEINDLTAGYIASTYYNIMEYKRQISLKYPILFKQPQQEEHKEEVEEQLDEDPTKQFGYTVPVSESWGWYDVINTVCNENKIEIDYWMDKPCEEFFTYLCYKIQKNNEQNLKLKQNGRN